MSRNHQSIQLCVRDNGQGIHEDKIAILGKTTVASQSGTGSALENLNRRLTGLFGNHAELQFDSSDKGTKVCTIIPHKYREEEM